MNREIKFRIYFNKMKCFGHFDLHDFIDSCDGYAGNRKEDFTLQQYTGVKDKNGKDIYEGDIIKVNRWHFGKNYEIIEGKTEIGYVYMGSVEWLMSFDHIRYDDIQKLEDADIRLEIVGNILQNPELVKYK